MKKRRRELELKDIRFQFILGIVLILIVINIGFVLLSIKIKNIPISCSNLNYGGDLYDIKPTISQEYPLNSFNDCIDKAEHDGCDSERYKGVCCYPIFSDRTSALSCIETSGCMEFYRSQQ